MLALVVSTRAADWPASVPLSVGRVVTSSYEGGPLVFASVHMGSSGNGGANCLEGAVWGDSEERFFERL